MLVIEIEVLDTELKDSIYGEIAILIGNREFHKENNKITFSTEDLNLFLIERLEIKYKNNLKINKRTLSERNVVIKK